MQARYESRRLHSHLLLQGDFDRMYPEEPLSAAVPLSEGRSDYYSLSLQFHMLV